MLSSRFDLLKSLYPSSAILGARSGIVGPLGLKIGYVNEGNVACVKKYEQGATIPLIAISEDAQLKIDVGLNECVKPTGVVVNHEVFSDFS